MEPRKWGHPGDPNLVNFDPHPCFETELRLWLRLGARGERRGETLAGESSRSIKRIEKGNVSVFILLIRINFVDTSVILLILLRYFEGADECPAGKRRKVEKKVFSVSSLKVAR